MNSLNPNSDFYAEQEEPKVHGTYCISPPLAATLSTAKGVSPCMYPHVLLQNIYFFTKAAATNCTAKWLFSSMKVHVLL